MIGSDVVDVEEVELVVPPPLQLPHLLHQLNCLSEILGVILLARVSLTVLPRTNHWGSHS